MLHFIVNLRVGNIKYQLGTLEFQINVLDSISVLVGKNVKINKHTGPNKFTGGIVNAL